MLYHRFLTEQGAEARSGSVTSTEIAEAIGVDPTQVRKDFGVIGVRGKGRVGFDAEAAVRAIRAVLGFDHDHPAVVVGAGRLGGALAAYGSFARYGLRVVAVFDDDPKKVGQEVGGVTVHHVRELKEIVRKRRVRLGVIATPPEVAQAVADRLVEAGVGAVWNFAPVHLSVPPSVALRHEHISLGLSELAHHLAREAENDG